jgi:hypothetical protein
VSGQFERDLLHAFSLARGRLVNLLHLCLLRCHLPFAGCYDVLLLQSVVGPQILRSLAGFIVIVLRKKACTLYGMRTHRDVYDRIRVSFRFCQEGLYAIWDIVYLLWVRSSTGQGQALAESCFSAASRLSKKGRIGEHTMPLEVYKLLDAMELRGTSHEAARSTRALRLATKPFELMRGPFVQQRRNDEQETEKAPFLVVRKVRDAILDETLSLETVCRRRN